MCVSARWHRGRKLGNRGRDFIYTAAGDPRPPQKKTNALLLVLFDTWEFCSLDKSGRGGCRRTNTSVCVWL